MRKVITTAITAALLCFLVGCASNDTITGNIDTDRLGIKLGTMKYIGEDADKAARVLGVVDKVEAELDANQIVLAEGVAAYIESRIDFAGKPAEEILLIQELILVVSGQIEERIGGQVIDPDSQVMIRQVIGWVREAAKVKKASLGA
jgi:hypothetical protein